MDEVKVYQYHLNIKNLKSGSVDLTLENNQVHVWVLNLDKLKDYENFLVKFLSQDELEKSGNFHFEIDQERFIRAKGLLRLLIYVYTAIPPESIIFAYNKFGKPELSERHNKREFNFNISHSKMMLAIAITNNASIGIDIEFFEPIQNFLDIARRYFSDVEYQEIEALHKDEVLESFYTCWTTKESILKLLGEGLSYPLNNFNVKIFKPEVGSSYKYDLRIEDKSENINLEIFRNNTEFTGAVARTEKIESSIYWNCDDCISLLSHYVQ